MIKAPISSNSETLESLGNTRENGDVYISIFKTNMEDQKASDKLQGEKNPPEKGRIGC